MAYRLALAVVLLSAPCTADESPVVLRTTGGEAWSFEKLIETSVPAGACDTAPIGTVTVQPEGERLVARADEAGKTVCALRFAAEQEVMVLGSARRLRQASQAASTMVS